MNFNVQGYYMTTRIPRLSFIVTIYLIYHGKKRLKERNSLETICGTMGDH